MKSKNIIETIYNFEDLWTLAPVLGQHIAVDVAAPVHTIDSIYQKSYNLHRRILEIADSLILIKVFDS